MSGKRKRKRQREHTQIERPGFSWPRTTPIPLPHNRDVIAHWTRDLMRKTIPQIDDALRSAINKDGKKGKRRMSEGWELEKNVNDPDHVTTETMIVTGGTLVRTLVWNRHADKPVAVNVVFFPGTLIK